MKLDDPGRTNVVRGVLTNFGVLFAKPSEKSGYTLCRKPDVTVRPGGKFNNTYHVGVESFFVLELNSLVWYGETVHRRGARQRTRGRGIGRRERLDDLPLHCGVRTDTFGATVVHLMRQLVLTSTRPVLEDVHMNESLLFQPGD